MTPTASQIVNELRAFVNDSVAAWAFAGVGLRKVEDELRRVVVADPDPEVFVGPDDPNIHWAPLAGWKRSEMLVKIARHGFVDTIRGQQWLVHLYAGWDEAFRPRLAAAHGCAAGDLQYPVWGDLRLLRNDVVHNRGVASSRQTGKCRVFHDWFTDGDLIVIQEEHVGEFVRAVPYARMSVPPVPGT